MQYGVLLCSTEGATNTASKEEAGIQLGRAAWLDKCHVPNELPSQVSDGCSTPKIGYEKVTWDIDYTPGIARSCRPGQKI